VTDGWRLAVHDELASTQDGVLAAARAGEAEGLAILALRQTAGRGTQGRPWQSRPGNLALSFLLKPAGPARDLPQWSLLAAVALADAVAAELPPNATLRLKWPNDLLLGGAKCAGILTEGAPAAGGIDWLVFGVGVNLAWAPELPDRPTACLAALITPPSPVAFAWRLLAAVDRWRQILAQHGFEPIRRAWLERGPSPGDPITLKQADGRVLQGSFGGLARDGRLLLCEKGRMVEVASGEVAG
jgi:BirA family biotin operon repressor/biotin-[acetyl-CoA-carboxylase] ligase